MVERTLSSFPKFLSEGIGNLLSPGSQNKGPAAEISRGFVTFLSTVHRYDKTGGKYVSSLTPITKHRNFTEITKTKNMLVFLRFISYFFR